MDSKDRRPQEGRGRRRSESEPIGLLVSFGFDVLNLNRIELSVFDTNPRAHRCYLKAGFVEEGRLEARRYKNGAYRDEILLAIQKDQWRARSP